MDEHYYFGTPFLNQWCLLPITTSNKINTNILAIRNNPSNPFTKIILNRQIQKKKKLIGLSSYMDFPNKISNKKFWEEYGNQIIFWCHCFRKPYDYIPSSIPCLLLSESDLYPHLDILYALDTSYKKYDFMVYLPNESDAKNTEYGIYWCNIIIKKFTILMITGDKFYTHGSVDPRINQMMLQPWSEFIKKLGSCRYYICFSEKDASPRMLIESLALNIPILVNKKIIGGWKYVIENETGRFFDLIYDEENINNQINYFIQQSYNPRRYLQKHIHVEINSFLFYTKLQTILNLRYSDFLDGILYINLDERKDRKLQMELQFHKMEIPLDFIIRINGIKNSESGHIGCCSSHIKALETAIDKNWYQCVILEDDFKFQIPKERFLYMISTIFNNLPEQWDVILLYADGIRQPLEIKDNLFYCRVDHAYSTAGYIVNKNFIFILLNNFKECYKLLTNEYMEFKKNNALETRMYYCKYAIDRHWQLLQKEYKFIITTPFIGTLSYCSSISSIMNPI